MMDYRCCLSQTQLRLWHHILHSVDKVFQPYHLHPNRHHLVIRGFLHRAGQRMTAASAKGFTVSADNSASFCWAERNGAGRPAPFQTQISQRLPGGGRGWCTISPCPSSGSACRPLQEQSVCQWHKNRYIFHPPVCVEPLTHSKCHGYGICHRCVCSVPPCIRRR